MSSVVIACLDTPSSRTLKLNHSRWRDLKISSYMSYMTRRDIKAIDIWKYYPLFLNVLWNYERRISKMLECFTNIFHNYQHLFHTQSKQCISVIVKLITFVYTCDVHDKIFNQSTYTHHIIDTCHTFNTFMLVFLIPNTYLFSFIRRATSMSLIQIYFFLKLIHQHALCFE